MAVNKPTGDNARKGAVKKRSQTKDHDRRRQWLYQAGPIERRVHGGQEAN